MKFLEEGNPSGPFAEMLLLNGSLHGSIGLAKRLAHKGCRILDGMTGLGPVIPGSAPSERPTGAVVPGAAPMTNTGSIKPDANGNVIIR